MPDQHDRRVDAGDKGANGVGVALDATQRVGCGDDRITVSLKDCDDAIPTRSVSERTMHKNDCRFGGLCRCYGPRQQDADRCPTATKIFIRNSLFLHSARDSAMRAALRLRCPGSRWGAELINIRPEAISRPFDNGLSANGMVRPVLLPRQRSRPGAPRQGARDVAVGSNASFERCRHVGFTPNSDVSTAMQRTDASGPGCVKMAPYQRQSLARQWVL